MQRLTPKVEDPCAVLYMHRSKRSFIYCTIHRVQGQFSVQ